MPCETNGSFSLVEAFERKKKLIWFQHFNDNRKKNNSAVFYFSISHSLHNHEVGMLNAYAFDCTMKFSNEKIRVVNKEKYESVAAEYTNTFSKFLVSFGKKTWIRRNAEKYRLHTAPNSLNSAECVCVHTQRWCWCWWWWRRHRHRVRTAIAYY